MTEVGRQRYGRRAFLLRTGVIGAAIALVDVPALVEARPAGAAAPSLSDLAPIFDALSLDTMNGLVAFVVPGLDAYSIAQGASDVTPGGVTADGAAFMLNALDNFYPVPQEPLLQLVQALTTGINANLPALRVPLLLEDLADELDKALQLLLAGEDEGLPALGDGGGRRRRRYRRQSHRARPGLHLGADRVPGRRVVGVRGLRLFQ
jgi:hypothetical protein